MKWNKNAILSVVCSAISIIIFWWLAFCGIGFGANALREIKTTNEKGKILSIIGIIIGIISVILYGYFKSFSN